MKNRNFSFAVALVTMLICATAGAAITSTPSRVTCIAKNDTDVVMGCVGVLHGITTQGVHRQLRVNVKVPAHRTRFAYIATTELDPFVKGYFVGNCGT